MSDGMQFLEVIRGGRAVEERQALMVLMAQSLGGARPRDLDGAGIEQVLGFESDEPVRRVAARLYAYLAAVEADSTLWLAWYRLNYIRSAYMLRPADTAIRNRVEAHLDELPDRERRMLEVPKMTREDAVLDRRSSSRARFQAILRDYPDYWWGWWVLADNSFHTGGLIYGTSPEETIAELRRTVELNPSFVPAWAHLAQALDRKSVV